MEKRRKRNERFLIGMHTGHHKPETESILTDPLRKKKNKQKTTPHPHQKKKNNEKNQQKSNPQKMESLILKREIKTISANASLKTL